MEEKALEIIEVDNCIGLRSNNIIYIHKSLKNYPALYDKVLTHEGKHTSKKTLSKKEWKMDLRAFKDLMSKEGLSFIFNNPKCLLQLSPIQKLSGKWLIDIEGILIAILLIGVLIWIL